MFRAHKRKSRPVSTPATHAFFTSDLPDKCESGVTAFAAEFDVSLDETDVYANLEFKSFLEDAVPIKHCDAATSQPRSKPNEESENSSTDNSVLMNKEMKEAEEYELAHSSLSGKHSMGGDERETNKDDEDDVFFRGSPACVVGPSQQKRKGRAPPPPKRLSSLLPLDDSVNEDVASDNSNSPLSSHGDRTDSAGCDGSNNNNDGCGPGLVVSHHALVAELSKRQKRTSKLYSVVDETADTRVSAGKGCQQEQKTLDADSERHSHEQWQPNQAGETSTQNATEIDSHAKSGGAGRPECPGKGVNVGGMATRAAQPLDRALGPGYTNKPKVTPTKPRIATKPVHLKSPVAVGLPEILDVKETKSNGSVSKVITPENRVTLGKNGVSSSESNNNDDTQRTNHIGDQEIDQRSSEAEDKNNVTKVGSTPVKWVILPKYSSHDNDDCAGKQKWITHSREENSSQETPVADAKSNGPMNEICSLEGGSLRTMDHIRDCIPEGKSRQRIVQVEDEDMYQRTSETRSCDLVSKITTMETELQDVKDHNHHENGTTGKTQQIMHSKDKKTLQRPGAADNKKTLQRPGAADNKKTLQRPGEADNKKTPQRPGAADNKKTLQRPGAADNKKTLQRPVAADNKKTLQRPGEADNKKTPQRPGAADNKKTLQRPGAADNKKTLQRPGAADNKKTLQRPGETDNKKTLQRPGEADNKKTLQRPGEADNKKTLQRPGEADNKIYSRYLTDLARTKYDSDLSSEEGAKVKKVAGQRARHRAGQPMSSTPIPPPRRRRLRSADCLKTRQVQPDNVSSSVSSSMSSGHSVDQGTSVSTGQNGACDSSTVTGTSVTSVTLPSPIRARSHSEEGRERDLGICLPPPPQFNNQSGFVCGECIDVLQSNRCEDVKLEAALEDRCCWKSDQDNDVSLSPGCHGLVSCDTLQDVSPDNHTQLMPRDPNADISEETVNTLDTQETVNTLNTQETAGQDWLNILVEEDYLPGQVPVASEILSPQPSQPWEVSMAMSAHLMDLACRPWDNTVLPPVGKAGDGTKPTIVDYVWQMKPVELWDTSDVCDWCKTALDFEALADVFQECATQGVQLLQLSGQDLTNLGVTDTHDRNTVLDEIARLQRKQRDSAPLWNVKQISITQKSLDLSDDMQRRHLHHLQELNDKQDVQSSDYLPDLQDEHRTSQPNSGVTSRSGSPQMTPLSTTPSSTVGRHKSSHNQMPLMTWTNKDVLAWLQHVGLGKFVGTFAEHKIMGPDLAGISMHLLDKLDIMTTDDREVILAELYKLQHPAGPTLEQVILEQRSWSSEYSDHSSSTTREDITEPVARSVLLRDNVGGTNSHVTGSHVTGGHVIDTKLGAENDSCVGDKARIESPMFTVDPLGNVQARRGSCGHSVVTPFCDSLQPDSFNSGQSCSDRSVTGLCGDNLELLQELALLRESVRERDDVIRQLRRDNTGRDIDHTDHEYIPLSEMLSGRGPQCIKCCTIQATSSGDFGFMVGRDSDDQVIIKHVAEGQALSKGDRLIEMNGRNVCQLQECEVIRLLQKVKDTLVVVVLRDIDSQPIIEDVTRAGELESMRDSLTLAILEVEATQQENKDLNEEMKRLKESRVSLAAENEQLHKKATDLKTRLAESETSRRGLYTILERIGNSAMTPLPDNVTPNGTTSLPNGQTKRVQSPETHQKKGHLAEDRHCKTANGFTSADDETDLVRVPDSSST